MCSIELAATPPSSPGSRTTSAVAAKSRGRYAEAVAGFEKALQLKGAEVGTGHLEYALRLLNLSDALKGAGRLDDALRTSDQGLAVMQKWLGPDHVDVGMAKANRGDLLMALNRIDEAAGAYTDALAIFHATLPAADPALLIRSRASGARFYSAASTTAPAIYSSRRRRLTSTATTCSMPISNSHSRVLS